MKLGYIRVSSKEQHIDRQKEELLNHGVDARYLFVDVASGRIINRDQYTMLKRVAREGDIIYIHELDRLGRSKQQILEELRYYKEKHITVRILDVPTTMIEYDQYGDTSQLIFEMVNNLLIEVLSTLAEHELARIHKRQVEGIRAAREKGVVFGRPKRPITDEFIAKYNEWKSGNITAVSAMRALQIPTTSFYAMVKRYEAQLKKDIG